MIQKLYVVISVFILSISFAMAQQGSIQGKIVDSTKNNEGIPFASVVAELNGVQVGGCNTDIDGNYSIKPLEAGQYDLKVSYVGFQPVEIVGIPVYPDKVTSRDIALSPTVREIKTFILKGDIVPVFEKDNVKSEQILTAGDVDKMAIRDVNSFAATAAGVYQNDDGSLSIRGARPEYTKYVVDGIPVIGSNNVPKADIEQISVLTGGIPASIGDVTGGVVSVTTKGPSREYSGGLEAYSSYVLDPYNQRLVAANFSGPLISKIDPVTKTKKPIAGFFLVAEYQGARDASPSYVGTYEVNNATLQQIQANPLIPRGLGQGYNYSADYITADDLNNLKYRDNAATNTFRFSGKLDFKPSQNTDFILGGSLEHTKQNDWINVYQIMNSANNPSETDNTYRVFARFTQRFKADTSAKSIIKNAFYSIQVDYSQNNQTIESSQYGTNIFDYGYIGKFTTYRDRTYAYGKDSATGLSGYLQQTFQDTLVTYTPGNVNPITSNYDVQYYKLANGNTALYNTESTISNLGGLLNGDRSSNIYGLDYGTGRVYNGYSFFNNGQYRISANGSADIGKHAISVGFEYEQSVNRDYSLNPVGIWYLMRQLANRQISQLNHADTQVVRAPDGTFLDTINYGRLYVSSEQSSFDKNLRAKLGMPVNGTNFIDIDTYDPSMFSLSMFSPDELLNNNNNWSPTTSGSVSYYGYDIYGNKLTSQPSFDDFFTQKNAQGNYTRVIGAFEPIYMAGYIQDKFVFNDLIFNVGLRVDRYDANQKVMKDPYSLYATHSAGDVQTTQLRGNTPPPSNIGSNYVTYVNDLNSPTSVVGYRDPSTNTWYDSQGNLVNDPSILAKATSTGTITPYLINPTDNIQSPNFVPGNSFVNYVPQISVMPRIAFSFPISDEALFFAHYDVLTQRPTSFAQTDPRAYFFMSQESGSLLQNPNLLPEKTIDYELGFKQKLSRSSSFTLSAFYRQLSNNIETVDILDAYPVSYLSFANVDFGTVKGMTFSYDLRRTQNFRITASYTLQFANGTGSGATSGFNVVNTGEPNIVVPMPLNFDQRHAIVTSVDYRFGSGVGDDTYDGPILFGKKILKGTGFNFIVHAGSGTPYTRQSNYYATQDFTVAARPVLTGDINGSRMPWQERIDMKIDKDIVLKTGRRNGEDKKTLFLNIYLQVNNLLNTMNILHVYATTGNPNDDGYLSAASSQVALSQQISPQTYEALYKVAVNAPGNYGLPRMIKLGASLNF